MPKNCKNDISVTIICNEINWSCLIQRIKGSGGYLVFNMPCFPYPNIYRAKAKIIIKCKADIIYETDYIYTSKIDGIDENNVCIFTIIVLLF